mmetsp:Transcript_71499/g.209568  ORF Transcript_71499/g.209568 Transcript_71499/m.209568 type:complete len:391 (-) Transcript_71499:1299-2471(-)
MTFARFSTEPWSCTAGTPNSSSAAATFRFRSSNWTKRITLAVGSSFRSSSSLRTSAASFVPYLSKRSSSGPPPPCGAFCPSPWSGSSGAGPAPKEEDEEEAAGASGGTSLGALALSSASKGLMSFMESGCLQMLQEANFVTVILRHSRQNMCAQGVIARRVRGSPSSRQTVQLLLSGASLWARLFIVRRKKPRDAEASWSSRRFSACSRAWAPSSRARVSAHLDLAARAAHCSEQPLRLSAVPRSSESSASRGRWCSRAPSRASGSASAASRETCSNASTARWPLSPSAGSFSSTAASSERQPSEPLFLGSRALSSSMTWAQRRSWFRARTTRRSFCSPMRSHSSSALAMLSPTAWKCEQSFSRRSSSCTCSALRPPSVSKWGASCAWAR